MRPAGGSDRVPAKPCSTPELLKKHGFEFIFEWQFDDLPCWMRTKNGPMIGMPYAIEVNDAVALVMHGHTGDEWLQRFKYVLETYSAELSQQPRILTLSLHPHVIGIPMRFPIFSRILDMLMARNDSVFMTGGQIADWFKTQDPEGLKRVS